MRARRLQHRAVSIAVLGSDGRLLVHRRADTKDVWPGHVGPRRRRRGGRRRDVRRRRARRELAEELGVEARRLDVARRGPLRRTTSVALIGRGYRCIHDGPFTFTDGEIAEVRWVDRAALDALMAHGAVRARQRRPAAAAARPAAESLRFCRSRASSPYPVSVRAPHRRRTRRQSRMTMYGANPEQLASLGRSLQAADHQHRRRGEHGQLGARRHHVGGSRPRPVRAGLEHHVPQRAATSSTRRSTPPAATASPAAPTCSG